MSQPKGSEKVKIVLKNIEKKGNISMSTSLESLKDKIDHENITLQGIVNELDPDVKLPTLKQLNLKFTNVKSSLISDKGQSTLVVTENSSDLTASLVAWQGELEEETKDGDPKHFFLAIELKVQGQTGSITLPLMSQSDSSKELTLKVALEVISEKTLSTDVCQKLKKLITNGDSKSDFPVPPDELESQITFRAILGALSKDIPINLKWKKDDDSSPGSEKEGDTSPGSEENESDSTTEDVQESVDSLKIKKIQAEYDETKSIFWLKLTGELQRFGMDLTLDELGIGFSFENGQYQFAIEGIEVTNKNETFKIDGGIKGTLNPISFAGELLIQLADSYSIAALAAYQKDPQGHPSFYGFLFLGGLELGEPPILVTGIAGGFGYNRELKLPTIKDVPNYPFVKAAIALSPKPGNEKSPFSDPTNVQNCMGVMDQYLAVQDGESWLAAGLSFTLCELVNGFLLLNVAWGVDFKIALIGVATYQQPPAIPGEEEEPAIVYAQLALEVVLAPESGVFSIDATLTSASFVIDPRCHLTGGFGFYIWYGNSSHAGEFVLTLGGYNSDYSRPSYYPQEDRLGFNWRVNSCLSMIGGAYLALTPSALMLGGSLNANWQSGIIRASFKLNMDCLVVWKPLHYDFDAGIHVTASTQIKVWFVKVTITVHADVDLHIWGPEFTGTAYIHVSVISFSINLGGSATAPSPLSWDKFAKEFLPKRDSSTAICDIHPVKGVLHQLDEEDVSWVVDPEHLVLRTQTHVPSTNVNITQKSDHKDSNSLISRVIGANEGDFNTDIDVAPMNLASENFTSTHQIELTSPDGSDSTMTAKAIKTTVPGALWKQGAEKDPSGDGAVVRNTLSGFELTPDFVPSDKTSAINTTYFTYSEEDRPFSPSPSYNHVVACGPFTEGVEQTINSATVQSNRSKILQALQPHLNVPTTVDVTRLASNDEFLSDPVLCVLGQTPD